MRRGKAVKKQTVSRLTHTPDHGDTWTTRDIIPPLEVNQGNPMQTAFSPNAKVMVSITNDCAQVYRLDEDGSAYRLISEVVI